MTAPSVPAPSVRSEPADPLAEVRRPGVVTVAPEHEHERGDVPGWVLVTLMTAGLVLALWAIAGPALTEVFESAIERVAGFGG